MKINRDVLQNASKNKYLAYLKLFPVLKKEKTRQYTFLSITFVTMIFFGIFAINPTLTTIVELQKKLEDAKLVNEQLDTKLANLSALRTSYNSLAGDLETVVANLPQTPKSPTLIGQLQSIASQNNLTINSVQSDAVPLTSLESVDVDDRFFTFYVSVVGNYNQLEQFLTQLTTFNRIIRFEVVTISRQALGEGQIIMAVQGRAYFEP